MDEGNNCYWVILSNSGGELDRQPAKTENEARTVALRMIRSVPFLSDGDSIRVVQGWSETME